MMNASQRNYIYQLSQQMCQERFLNILVQDMFYVILSSGLI